LKASRGCCKSRVSFTWRNFRAHFDGQLQLQQKGFSISDLTFSSSAKPLGVIPSALWAKTENDEMRKKTARATIFHNG
jgi:hypothetical protein